MIIFKFVKLGALLASLFLGSHAAADHLKKDIPPTCPSINLIKSTPFNDIQKGDHPGVWTLIQSHQKYDTTREWVFSLVLEADSEEDAYKKGQKALSSLQFSKGPAEIAYIWFCDYQTSPALSAVAMTKAF